jgi:archaeal flagellar protein FlaJ
VTMATSNAPASVRRVHALAPSTATEGLVLTRERLCLIFGGVAAIVLYVIAGLEYAGRLHILLRAGEPTGWNPAIDFFVLGTIAFIAPYGFAETARQHRISKIEERLPDFLRDVAEAGRFGMTLPDAIIVASTGRYGLLTDEIKKMASQLEWGVPVATALRLFEERVPTPLTQRVVSIVTRANEAGGNVADVLSMVAHDTREAQLADASRKISMLTYLTVIYISFFVFIVTIFIMSAIFLPEMIKAGIQVSSSTASLGGAAALPLQYAFIPELFLAFLVAVIVHAIGDGIMAGVLYNGRIAEGLQHATILLAIGWVIMRFFVPVLHT